MFKKASLILLIFLVPFSLVGQELNHNSSDTVNFFVGNWKIDLRPTPESEGYYQSFIVEALVEKTFTGTFYGSEIKNAFLNDHWPRIYFAFSTSDQSNEYYHSGYIEKDQLFGVTYCPNRDFIMPWTGTKAE